MNEYYALDPRVSVSLRDLKSFLQRFGLREGRFLSKYPLDWPSRFTQNAQQLPDVERARVLELWRKNKLSLIPLPGVQYNEAMDWELNAKATYDRPGLWQEVFGREGNPFGWRSVGDVLDEVGNDLLDGRGGHICMKADVYAKCVAPLFSVSEEVTLVDPYFYLANRDYGRSKILRALLELAKQTAVRSVRLICEEKHIADTMSCFTESDFLRKVDEAVDASSLAKLSVRLLDKAAIGHGRYIFSCHGGLQFDHGFEEREQKRNHVHWLSDKELHPIQERFAFRTRC